MAGQGFLELGLGTRFMARFVAAVQPARTSCCRLPPHPSRALAASRRCLSAVDSEVERRGASGRGSVAGRHGMHGLQDGKEMQCQKEANHSLNKTPPAAHHSRWHLRS